MNAYPGSKSTSKFTLTLTDRKTAVSNSILKSDSNATSQNKNIKRCISFKMQNCINLSERMVRYLIKIIDNKAL